MSKWAEVVFFLGVTAWAEAAPNNQFQIKPYSGDQRQNYPQILHFWAKAGEYPAENYPQAQIGGRGLQTQVNVKSRWADGSIRDALIAFVVPELSGELTVTFGSQTTCNCEPGTGLSQADMLSPAWDFDAKQTISAPPGCQGCTDETASARAILERWDGVTNTTKGSMYWMYGSVVTEVVLAEHESKLSDIGYKAAPAVRISSSGDSCADTAVAAATTRFCASSVAGIAPGQYVAVYGTFHTENMRVCAVDQGSNTFQVGVSACPNVDGRGFGGTISGTTYRTYPGGLPAHPGSWLPASSQNERPLRPWFTVQFWPTLNRYRTVYHMGNYDTTKLQTQHFGLRLALGSGSPATIYSYRVKDSLFSENFLMQRPQTEFGLSRPDGLADQCTPEFWSKGYQRPCASIRYPFEYWGAVVRIIPNYATDFPVRAADVDLRVRTYNTSAYLRMTNQKLGAERLAPLGNGSMLAAMATTGGRDELGLWPVWCLDALHGYDWRAQNLCELNALKHHGAFPFFLMEGDGTRDVAFNGQERETIGRPVTLRSRPDIAQLVPWTGPTAPKPISPQPEAGFARGNHFDFLVDDAHMYDPYTLLYIMNGDYAVLHRAWMMGTYLTATGSKANSLRMAASNGSMSIGRFGQVRATGRLLWTMAHTEAISPDEFAEKQWFRDTIHEWLAAESGIFDLKNSVYYQDAETVTGIPGITRRAVWDWGRNFVSRLFWGSAAFAQSGIPHSLGYHSLDIYNNPPYDPAQIDGTITHRSTSPWMDNFSVIAFGRLIELGWKEALPLFQYRARYCAETSAQPPPVGLICGSYRVPVSFRTVVTMDADTSTVRHSGHNVKEGDVIEFAVNILNTRGTLPKGLSFDGQLIQGGGPYYLATEVTSEGYKLKDPDGNPVQFADAGSGTIYAVTRMKTPEEQLSGLLKSWREKEMTNGTASGFGSSTDAYNNAYGSFQLGVLAQACQFGVPYGCEGYRNVRESYNRLQRRIAGRVLCWDWEPLALDGSSVARARVAGKPNRNAVKSRERKAPKPNRSLVVAVAPEQTGLN